MWRFLAALFLLLVAAAMVVAALRPVCVALTPAQLRRMDPPFEDRADRDLLLIRVYQRRDSVDYECRTWITRELLQ